MVIIIYKSELAMCVGYEDMRFAFLKAREGLRRGEKANPIAGVRTNCYQVEPAMEPM